MSLISLKQLMKSGVKVVDKRCFSSGGDIFPFKNDSETRVVKIARKKGIVVQDCNVYIGRKIYKGGWSLPQSKWHNPFVRQSDSLEHKLEAIAKYEQHVRNSPQLMDALPELKGKVLGCWCKVTHDIPCHGDVLVKLLAEREEAQDDSS